MIIRNASLDDATVIAEIYEFDLGYKTDINSIGNKLYKYFVAENTPGEQREAIFVAELDDKVVGVIHIEKFETLYYKPIANILSLAVREEYRHRGVGKALVDEPPNGQRKKGLTK